MSRSRRIVRARLWRVRIPLRMVYVSSMYVMRDTLRTVIALEADDGSVGLGEAHGSEEVFRLVEGLAREALGGDPAERRGLQLRWARSVFDNRNGRSGWSAMAGVEMALWDLVARQADVSLAAFLAGRGRDRVELVCPVPAVMLDRLVPRKELEASFADPGGAAKVVEYAVDHARRFGFRSFKYKSAAASAEFDLAVMKGLREALPQAKLRFDPNAGYPPAQAIALCRRLEPLGLEFFEDPTDDQDGLARLKAEIPGTAVASNMAVIQVDQLAAARRRPPVDVILADLFMWGGLLRFRAMVEAATAFGFEVAVHSLFETGIGTAANLQLAAAFGEIRRANDSGLHVLEQDVIRPGALEITNGGMEVPDGAGLGVDLDQDRVAALAVESRVVEP